ncbi:MAG: site-2 protease family protein [Gammaproteobacteria bacterium]
MPSLLELVQTIAVWALPVLFAITLHEVAHGWAARALGDNTAAMMGRLSLNPIKHVDLVGTIIVPLVFVLLPGNFLFGWAKPVPVSARNLRQPRRDMALVAVAGPLANLAMAFGWGLLLKLALAQDGEAGLWMGIQLMATAGIVINLVLMALNLLPVPPLDGAKVLGSLLPPKLGWQFDRIAPYGMFIIVILMVTQLLGPLLRPIIGAGQVLLTTVLGLS